MNQRNASHKTAYFVTHLVAHLARSGRYARLFDLLEDKDFLARQADTLGGFRQGSLDLERHVLPMTIERSDWPRFLRHATVAMGLRGLAEALADEEIVGALVRHGRTVLAVDIVEQLTDPNARIRARAVILSALPRAARDRPGKGGAGTARLVEELDAVPPLKDPAAARGWLATLQTVARHLGPELRKFWSGWIERLCGVAPELADDAWLAVAESWLGRDLGPRSGLWPALAEVTPERVLRFLPRRLASAPRHAAALIDSPLPPPFQDRKELLTHLRLALLAAGVVADPWSRVRELPIESVESVELGRELWPRLAPERRDRLAAKIDDPIVRAAFRVVALEGLRKEAGEDVSTNDETAALTSLEGLPPEVELHWTLRCLATCSPSRRRLRHVRTVALHLYTQRYDVPHGEDLARFIDLIAEVLPQDLSRVLPNAVAAPASHAETLRILAVRCERTEVLEQLGEKVERYAAAAGDNDGEGFQLRAEVLSRITGRLCRRRQELTPYREALERLLPEEEDPLRLAVIDELAAGSAACRRLALEVCGELRSRRLALRGRLRLSSAGERLDEALSPAALYRAVAGSRAISDELAALEPLLELPATANDQRGSQGREGLFLDVHDSDRRILAILDLARHDLAFQRRRLRPGQIDPVAALQPLSRVVGGVTSDRRLVALMSELVEMGTQVSPNQAVAELQQSLLRLLGLEKVEWRLRAEAVEALLCHVWRWVEAADDIQAPGRRQAAVTFFRWLACLPAQSDLPDELGGLWPELLPVVLAAAERLPASCRDRLRCPWPAAIERLIPRLWERRRSPWVRGAEGFAAWAGGTPEVLAACFAAADELAAHLDETLDSRGPSPVAQSLLCLLAARDPERATRLLERLAPAARQALALRLLRHGWLEDLPITPFWDTDDPAIRPIRLARALRRKAAERDAEAVAEGVAAALSGNELDPLDARSAPERRALWAVDAESCCAPIARAAVSALAGAGREPAERALCFWVHGWVKPRLGEEAPESRERRTALMAALRQAETIPGLSTARALRE